MSRLIPICIVIGIIFIGHISKRIDLSEIKKRKEFTSQYRNKLIGFLNDFLAGNPLNQPLYYELTTDINPMQWELGKDGIAYVQDPLNGVSSSNYQLLINFLPELRRFQSERDNIIIMNRLRQSAENCDDMFIRHLGTLNELDKSYRKTLYNPFSCFSDGMKFIVSLPILILNWFGLLSDEHARRAKKSWIVKFISFIIVLLGVISAIVTITLGWNDFSQLIQRLVSSICNGSLLKW